MKKKKSTSSQAEQLSEFSPLLQAVHLSMVSPSHWTEFSKETFTNNSDINKMRLDFMFSNELKTCKTFYILINNKLFFNI